MGSRECAAPLLFSPSDEDCVTPGLKEGGERSDAFLQEAPRSHVAHARDTDRVAHVLCTEAAGARHSCEDQGGQQHRDNTAGSRGHAAAG